MPRKLTGNNLRKTLRFVKKNGVVKTFYTVLEKFVAKEAPYTFEPISEEERNRQVSLYEKETSQAMLFSIIVPAYETKKEHLREMVDSCLHQTYPFFELIIADASSSDLVEQTISEYKDQRIRYYRLEENDGISNNTNAALQYAMGEYVGLLDHDDALCNNALHECYTYIRKAKENNIKLQMLFSDEDKGDDELHTFFEPNRKLAFNLDYFLSNNYICHFTMIQVDLIKELKFRKEYDGAQDFDIFLRVVDHLKGDLKQIAHIPMVLYHWRCHVSSTAQNPESKMYAYEAGKNAVADFVRKQGWKATVKHTPNLGFYRVCYEGNIFEYRNDIAAIGGNIIRHGKIVGGAMSMKGKPIYEGLLKYFDGYMHRAVLQQDVEVLDIRNIRINPMYEKDFLDILKLFHIDKQSNYSGAEEKVKEASIAFAKRMQEKNLKLLFDPFYQS